MWEKEVVGVGYMEHSQLPYFTSSLSQKIPRKLRVSSWDIFSNFNLFFRMWETALTPLIKSTISWHEHQPVSFPIYYTYVPSVA